MIDSIAKRIAEQALRSLQNAAKQMKSEGAYLRGIEIVIEVLNKEREERNGKVR